MVFSKYVPEDATLSLSAAGLRSLWQIILRPINRYNKMLPLNGSILWYRPFFFSLSTSHPLLFCGEDLFDVWSKFSIECCKKVWNDDDHLIRRYTKKHFAPDGRETDVRNTGIYSNTTFILQRDAQINPRAKREVQPYKSLQHAITPFPAQIKLILVFAELSTLNSDKVFH